MPVLLLRHSWQAVRMKLRSGKFECYLAAMNALRVALEQVGIARLLAVFTSRLSTLSCGRAKDGRAVRQRATTEQSNILVDYEGI